MGIAIFAHSPFLKMEHWRVDSKNIKAKIINRTSKVIKVLDTDSSNGDERKALPIGPNGTLFLYKSDEPIIYSAISFKVESVLMGNRTYIYIEEK